MVVGSLYSISLPALQVAEIQKIELPVILGMIDGVHILGEVETRSHLLPSCSSAPSLQVPRAQVGPCPTHPLHLLTAVQPVVVTQGSVGLGEATCGAVDGLAPPGARG